MNPLLLLPRLSPPALQKSWVRAGPGRAVRYVLRFTNQSFWGDRTLGPEEGVWVVESQALSCAGGSLAPQPVLPRPWALRSPVGTSLSPQGEFFHLNHRSAVPFLAPAISPPGDHDRMVYFAISDYVFNTASLVYYQAGYLNFSITDDMVRTVAEQCSPVTM